MPVGANFTAAAVRVGLDFTHPNVSDIDTTLIDPAGRRFTLFYGVGGSGADIHNLVLESGTGTPIAAGSAPFDSPLQGPFEPFTALLPLIGQSPQGTWHLELRDRVANGLSGTLDGWRLEFDEPATEAEPNPPAAAQDIPIIGALDGTITTGDLDAFHFIAGDTGLFTAHVRTTSGGLDPRLQLINAAGAVVASADDLSPSDPSAALAVHLQPGDYRLIVVGQRGTTGGYELVNGFVPGTNYPEVPVDSFPRQAVVADVNGDGIPDLLSPNPTGNGVSVRIGAGDGTFRPPTAALRVPVGPGATGLAVRDLTRLDGGVPDGILDLLVGNKFGDLLVVPGVGDGRFLPFRRAGDAVPLAVADRGDGTVQALVASPSLDSVAVQVAPQGDPNLTTVFRRTRDDNPGLLAPGAVRLARLDGPGDPFLDLIVAAGSSNSVLVYKGTGPNTFAAPMRYFAGTDPVDVTVADLDGDGVLDLATANRGSNDLSVLRGVLGAGGWSAVTGPRLSTGGVTPAGVSVRTVPGGLPSLLAAGADDSVQAIPNRGQGFFNDAARQTLLAAGPAIIAPPSFDPLSGRGVQVSSDGTAFSFNLSDPGGARAILAAGGVTAATLQALAVPETTAAVAVEAAAEVVTAELVVGVAEQDGVRSWWPTAGGAAVAGLVPPALLLLARSRRERRPGRVPR